MGAGVQDAEQLDLSPSQASELLKLYVGREVALALDTEAVTASSTGTLEAASIGGTLGEEFFVELRVGANEEAAWKIKLSGDGRSAGIWIERTRLVFSLNIGDLNIRPV